jgi:hypothetical protein
MNVVKAAELLGYRQAILLVGDGEERRRLEMTDTHRRAAPVFAPDSTLWADLISRARSPATALAQMKALVPAQRH